MSPSKDGTAENNEGKTLGTAINTQQVDTANNSSSNSTPKPNIAATNSKITNSDDNNEAADNSSGISIHQAVQQGNLHLTKNLIENGYAKVNDRDSDNVTPLHWAAINNHVIMAKYLIDNGAEIDALGGELVATPLHWAARNGHLSLVTLLINHGADPNTRDSQGFNALHLATHSSNSMLVLYLLYQDMDIDTPDTLQHTPLMWAAYQGDTLTVDLLIELGASVDKIDASQFTALHWAVIKGNPACMKKLVEAGSDIKIKEENGKTPEDIATETNAQKVWRGALSEAVKVLVQAQVPDAMMRTPYFTSLFQATAFWFCLTYIFKILVATSYLFVTNIIFFSSIVTSLYSFYTAVLADPGFVSKLKSREEQKQLIIDLANKGMLDARHLCFKCLIKKPLRSKHCKICDRCVARFDQRKKSSSLYDLFRQYDITTAASPYKKDPSDSCFVSETICGYFAYDSWTIALCFWVTLHLIWSIGLLGMQCYQISVAKTTNEMANFHRYSYFGNRTAGNIREQILATLAAGPGAGGAAQNLNKNYQLHSSNNPFDFGCWNNCIDFWSQGNGGMLQNVDWYGLYDVPLVERKNSKMSRRRVMGNNSYISLRGDEDTV
nr:15355_t:CDS:10 [Entrophospora candida]CAG8508550.1 5799_t:CDS:10 [Entrophospora candida]